MKLRRRTVIRHACLALLGLGAHSAAREAAGVNAISRSESWDADLLRSAGAGKVVVVLWGTAGCPWCAALRAEVMVHLWRNAERLSLQVVEFDMNDTGPLAQQPELNPAALSRRLGIRVSPTVSFHGPAGELADRLVGYPSRDFYSAYLDERLEQARRKLKGR